MNLGTICGQTVTNWTPQIGYRQPSEGGNVLALIYVQKAYTVCSLVDVGLLLLTVRNALPRK